MQPEGRVSPRSGQRGTPPQPSTAEVRSGLSGAFRCNVMTLGLLLQLRRDNVKLSFVASPIIHKMKSVPNKSRAFPLAHATLKCMRRCIL
jgi:hypothetical protein